MKVSVAMPVYNEQATLPAIVAAVFASPFDIELLCVDDGSTDTFKEMLAQLQSTYPGMRVLLQAPEHGQRSGLAPGHPARRRATT